MPWGAIAGAVISGVIQNKASGDANDASRDASQATIDEQRAARDQARNDLMPYSQYGQQAIPQLSRLNSGDYSGFLNSPDYLAALNQGQGQIDHSAAARGGLFGGGHTKDTIAFGSGLASQYLGNYRNSLINQLGGGQNAAAGMGGYSQNAAGQIGSAYGNMGAAGAQSAYDRGNNLAGMVGAAGNAFGQWYGNRSAYPQSSPSYTGLGGNPTYGGSSGGSPFTAQYGADYTRGMFS